MSTSDPVKVLFVASEAVPFSATGGLAEVVGALPKALKSLGVDARVMTPLYSAIDPKARSAARFIGSVTVPLAWRRQYCGIYEADIDGITHYLLDNEHYFKREGFYGHFDDGERFAFFSKASLEVLPHIQFQPDVVHSSDWHTALVPVFLKAFYSSLPAYQKMRSVFTIHNIQYQGQMSYSILGDILGLGDEWREVLDYDGCLNLLKGGIEAADAVTTVSPTYAAELLTPEYGHGLDRLLAFRMDKLRGILNGIDIELYDPTEDKSLYATYSSSDLSGKAINKEGLQKQMGLEVKRDAPLIGMVTRLTESKGIDLVVRAAASLVASGVQLAVLASGDRRYELFFHHLAQANPGMVSVDLSFKPELARRIYAGSDIFLMPSRTEACGLAQLIALRYGTIPVVRNTGGLHDTIHECDVENSSGNGFLFHEFDALPMESAVQKAVSVYRDCVSWHKLVTRAMESDYSWGRSASGYSELYSELTRNSKVE